MPDIASWLVPGQLSYRDLEPQHRKFLMIEWDLSQRVPSILRLLRNTPYPLDPDTAAAVEALARHHVLPWAMLRSRYLRAWVREGSTATGGWEADMLEVCWDPEDRPNFEAGTDSRYEMAAVYHELFEDDCDILQEVIGGLPRDTSVEVGSAVDLPLLPFGYPSLSRIALVRGVWIDRAVVELGEWVATLLDRGFVRLQAFDEHPLAWHRFFPPETRWTNPRPAALGELAALRDEARNNLAGYVGRTHEVDGRPYLHFEDFAVWEGRRLTGDLRAARVEGLGIRSWNEWVERESSGDGVLDLWGDIVGTVKHPCLMVKGRDYVVCDASEARGKLTEREEALAEVHELAHDKALSIDPSSILTSVQLAILQALREQGSCNSAELAEATGYGRRTLYNPGGIHELMERGLVVKGPKSVGYCLGRTPRPT